jgi:hypothetical protein
MQLSSMFANRSGAQRLVRTWIFLCCLAVVVAGRLPGQTISGRVYDSVAKAPLFGATVQLVPSKLGSMPPMQATTDSGGGYTLNGVPAGAYVLGFYHAVLDSIGIEPPFVRIEVGGATKPASLRVDLGVPGPARIIAAACGSPRDTSALGMVAGRLYDATSRDVVGGGTVVAEWQRVGLANGTIVVSRPQLTAITSADGWFAFCGVPRNDDVTLAAIRGADTTGAVTVRVPAAGLVRRALYIDKTEVVTVAIRDSLGAVDTTRGTEVVHRGHARLTGTVVDADSHRPLAGANVAIAGEALSQTTNDRGAFTISGAPGGTQTVLIRAVGYAPERRSVDLLGDQPLTLEIRLTTLRKMLDTMRVTASRLYSRDASGFERRRRSGFGTFFDSADVKRYHPFETTRLVERASGVRLYGSGMNQRILVGHVNPCEASIFIDGVTYPDFTGADLNMMVSPEEIVGVEVYTSAALAPVQYKSVSAFSRNGRNCGSIVIWTKRSR